MSAFAFTLPVIVDILVTTASSLVISSITGTISASSLAAAGVGNQAFSLISALFGMLSTGAAVLVSRAAGRGDRIETTRLTECSLFLSVTLSLGFMLAMYAVCPIVMRLLMPGADAAFLGEGTLYFRTMLLSIPGFVLTNTVSGLLRACGDAKSVLLSVVIACAMQVAGIWLFVTRFAMGILGVALANNVYRYVCCAILLIALFKNRRDTDTRVKGILRPDRTHIRRIFSIGVPASIDALAVQTGYVSINSLMVSLAGGVASVINVINAVLVFTGLTQSIGSIVSTTFVGHLAGRGEMNAARKMSMKILFWCELASMILCIPTVVCPRFVAGLFTQDAEILERSSAFLWVLIPYCVVAVGCNVCEPSARVGGSVRFVMREIVCCVLLIRLPLTYLLCVVLKMGEHGIYLANIISLAARSTLATVKILSHSWGKEKRSVEA